MLVNNSILANKLLQQKAREESQTEEFKKYKTEEAKRYIKTIIAKKLQLKLLVDEINEIKTQIGLSGVEYNDLPKNPNVSDDAILNYVLMLETQTENLNNLIAEYKADILQADTILKSLSSSPYAYEIIRRHFFKRENYVYISHKVNYSVAQIKRILTDALLELYDKLPYTMKTPIPKAV